jgi:hypothetical protein
MVSSLARDFRTIIQTHGLDDIAQLKTPVLGTISHKKGWPDAL